MKKTKFICPTCRRTLVMTKEQSKPHCLKCGFVCRRTGNSMILEDKRKPRETEDVYDPYFDPWKDVDWK